MKYKDKFSLLTCGCPPNIGFKAQDIQAFRWVHSNINHRNNFLPVLEIEPNRFENFTSCEEKCDGYGISLFNNLENAEAGLLKHLKRKPQLKNVFGDSIAAGNINESDGLTNKASKKGHFTLHESLCSNIKTKFVIIKKIKSE